jgi:hypothetical protein
LTLHLPKPKPKSERIIDKPVDIDWFTADNQNRKRTPCSQLETWWHCANMPGAEHIIQEQLQIIKDYELPNVHACVLGKNIIDNPNITIEYQSDNFGEYENPTLQRLWESARKDQTKGFLYFHSKGASAPNDAVKTNWRKVMTDAVVKQWKPLFDDLNDYDLIGANWQNCCLFCGNFWLGRGDWIAHLDSPTKYRNDHLNLWWAGHPWARMHAECWIGMRHYHNVKSLVCIYQWWEAFARMGM